MIEVKACCGHFPDAIKGIVMRVIAGDLRPHLAIGCPECAGLLFSISGEAFHSRRCSVGRDRGDAGGTAR